MSPTDPEPVDRPSDPSPTGRRSVLRTLAAAGVAVTAPRLATGVASAASPSSWDEGGDAYYSGLVEDLADEAGLGPAEFVFADTEVGTRDHENVSVYANGYGSTTQLGLSEDDVPFTRANRFAITADPESKYDVALRADLPADVADGIRDGDAMLAVVYLRAPDGAVKTEYYAEGSNESAPWLPTVGAEWQRYYCPVEYAAGSGQNVQFWFGFDRQTVDVGGFALLNFGQNESFDALPSGAAGEVVDAYYDQLREDLQETGLPAGSYLFAETESGARETFHEDAGDYGSVSSLDVAADEVPFAVAKRYEVASTPDAASDVQLYAAVDRQVSAGEVMLAVCWLRSSSTDPSVAATAVDGDDAGNRVRGTATPSVTSEWTRHYFPIRFESDAPAGDAYFQLKLGAKPQTVDVGGVALLTYGQDVAVSDLPSATGTGTGTAGAADGPTRTDDSSGATDATGPGMGIPAAVAAASGLVGANWLAGRLDEATDDAGE